MPRKGKKTHDPEDSKYIMYYVLFHSFDSEKSAFLCLAYSVDLSLAHHVKFDSIILTYFIIFTLDLINLAW